MSDEENNRLLEEIDKLADNPVTDDAIKKSVNIDGLIFLVVIIIVVLAAAYSYYKNDIDEEELPIVADNTVVTEYKEVTYDEYYGNDSEETIDYDMSEEEAKLDFENKKKNLVVSSNIINVNNKLITSVENKNNANVLDFEVYAIFYDGENNIIGIDEQSIEMIHANKKAYVCFEHTPESYERSEIFINKKYYYIDSSIKYLTDMVEIKDQIVDDKIEISVTNKSNEKMDQIDLTVVYYDDKNNILDIEEGMIFDLRKNKTEVETCYGVRENKSFEKVEYGYYEIIVNYATKYDY